MKKQNSLPPIHLAASTDDLRPAMQHIMIKDGIAYASDAHILAIVSLSENSDLTQDQIEKLNGKVLHRDTWGQIYNGTIQDVTETGVVIKKNQFIAEYKFTNAADIRFPDYINTAKRFTTAKDDPISEVTYDPTLLNVVSKILETRTLNMRHKEKLATLAYGGDAIKRMVIIMRMINNSDQMFDFSFF
jgi:hypothetical protein